MATGGVVVTVVGEVDTRVVADGKGISQPGHSEFHTESLTNLWLTNYKSGKCNRLGSRSILSHELNQEY